MNSIGIYEKALMSNDFEESLHYAKKIGYDYWEISIDADRKQRLKWSPEKIDKLIDICNKTDMPIFNMVLSVHRDFPLGSHDDAIQKKAINYLYQAIDLSRKLGIRTIQLAGYYTLMDEHDGSKERYIEALKETVGYAASNGIMLGIENMDRDLLNIQDILTIVKAVNNPYLGVFLDVGNFAANNLDPISELEPAIPYLVGLHLKETRISEYRRVKFGEGIVDFEATFNFLREKNYKGYLGVEMWNDEDPDSFDTIKESINWLKEQQNKISE